MSGTQLLLFPSLPSARISVARSHASGGSGSARHSAPPRRYRCPSFQRPAYRRERASTLVASYAPAMDSTRHFRALPSQKKGCRQVQRRQK